MSLITILGLAVALALDAFAVSIVSGISLKRVNFRQTFRLSWHFGLFQALMTVIGWSVGLSFRSIIENYAPWIAFCLLVLVGGNMIRAAFQSSDAAEEKQDPTRGKTMVFLSVATSIDALTVGLSLSLLRVSIIWPATVIGIVALVFTVVGLHLGQRMGVLLKVGMYAEVAGGLVLVGIGIDVLHRHGALTIF